VAAERKVLARAKAVHSQCVRPVFVNGDFVVIRWIFRFTWQDDTVIEMEELAYQRWEGEQIASETFFYDPAQRVPMEVSDTHDAPGPHPRPFSRREKGVACLSPRERAGVRA
jgi:hypothetical protein